MTTWLDAPLMGFDTETTGTDVSADRVVTAALVLSTGAGRETESISTWLIDPGIEIPEAASAVHGISSAYARDHGIAPVQGLDEVADILAETLEQDIPIVAYNATYDLSILEAELQRHGLPTLRDRLGREIAPIIDPLVLDRHLDRYRRGDRKLGTLCGHYGVSQDGALHSADVDVSATLDVLRCLCGHFGELCGMTLPELHQMQVSAHRAWADDFQQYLRRKGRDATISPVWPL